ILFFQAEDGIRYRNVTGVQTCALPISLDASLDRTRKPLAQRRTSANVCPLVFCSRHFVHQSLPHIERQKVRDQALCLLHWLLSRSEERRVGKECRSKCWTEPTKKHNEG